MRPHKFTIFFSFLFFFLSLSNLTYSKSLKGSDKISKNKKFKILHVMSYHSPWRWTDGQMEGFKKALEGINVEYKVFQMDTKRNSSKNWKEKKGKEAREIINKWHPDLVYVTDDDAQEYVTKFFINSNIPFVFSGVNKTPNYYGFDKSKNITGVLEREHFIESINLLKKLVPNIKKIVIIFDDADMWYDIKERMMMQTKKFNDIEFFWETIHSFEEYKNKIKKYQNIADAIGTIGIFNFKDKNNQNVPYQEVLKWTVENSKLPDFSFWVDRVYFGTLCAVTVSEYEQGLSAGKIAYQILVEGKRPNEIPVAQTIKGKPIINIKRAKNLGLKIDSEILLSIETINEYQWEQYGL